MIARAIRLPQSILSQYCRIVYSFSTQCLEQNESLGWEDEPTWYAVCVQALGCPVKTT